MYINVLYDIVWRNIELVISKGFLDDAKLWDYEKNNVHSILQYCLLRIEGLDLIPLPEYKIRFRVPIDKLQIDERFEKRKGKKVWFTRVDVAYLKDLDVIGVGEVFTPDEIHGVLESRRLSAPWITPRHRIEYLAKYQGLDFLIVINVVNRLPSWGDARQHTTEEWAKLWTDFIKEVCLNHKIQCLHITMRNIRDVEYNLYPAR